MNSAARAKSNVKFNPKLSSKLTLILISNLLSSTVGICTYLIFIKPFFYLLKVLKKKSSKNKNATL